MSRGKIFAVGIGPGSFEHLTKRAVDALSESQVVVGYNKYIERISKLTEGKELISTGMKGEVERVRLSIEKASEGKKVAVVSSGDAGIYGMAGLVLEMLEERDNHGIDFESIPGVTAACAASSLLGAPLMNDFVVLSLSDLLTPREEILKRAESVIMGDLVCVLYNPRSTKRKELFDEIINKLICERGGSTPFGLVKHASDKDKEEKILGRLDEIPTEKVDMSTIVIIGNSKTVLRNGMLITLRGYGEKYGYT